MMDSTNELVSTLLEEQALLHRVCEIKVKIMQPNLI